MSTKRDVLERAGIALSVGSDPDLVGALAYAQTNPNAEEHEVRDIAEIDARTELGSQLVRLKLGGDASVASRVALLLERWARHQRPFLRSKRVRRADLVSRFVGQCLHEWLFATCTECHGRQLVGLDRGEIVERRIRCVLCAGRGWLNEVPRYTPKSPCMNGLKVRSDCRMCGGGGWRTLSRVRQRKTEQCGKCKGTGLRIADNAERAMALGVDVRVYEKHWEWRFSWLASGLDRLEHLERRCLQSQLRTDIRRT